MHSGIKNADEQTDDSGDIAAPRQYDAFGSPITSSGTWAGPFGYGGPYGYQTDNDHGLMLLGHRYYESDTGRFLTRDPIKDGRNWYGYCDGSPITNVDVDGMQKRALTTTERGIVRDAILGIAGDGWLDTAIGLENLHLEGRILIDPAPSRSWAETSVKALPREATIIIKGKMIDEWIQDLLPDQRWAMKLWLQAILVHEYVHTRQNFLLLLLMNKKAEVEAWDTTIIYLEEHLYDKRTNRMRQGPLQGHIETAKTARSAY